MIKSDLKRIARYYGAEIPDTFEWKPRVFPKYAAPVIVEAEGKRSVVPMQFGLIPFFEKDPKPKKVFHNARRETLAEKVSFKKAFKETRCIVPMESFMEYIWESDKRKWLARFYLKDDELLSAAGVWSAWKSPTGELVNSYSIVTTDPPKFIADTGHDRCPLFLSNELAKGWLDSSEKSQNRLKEILSMPVSAEFLVEPFSVNEKAANS